MKFSGCFLALHGFFGSGQDWRDAVEYANTGLRLDACPDLPGHGCLADLPDDHRLYRLEPLLHWLRARIAALPERPRTLIGYSLGGRIAIHLAHRFPESIDRLVLIGASFGIADPIEREARLQLDMDRAARLRQIGPAAFHREWIANPLLASRQNTPADLLAGLESRRHHAKPEGLATALSAFSPGRIPAISPTNLRYCGPILLLSGDLDQTYTASNALAAQTLTDAITKTIPASGHSPHFENPHDSMSVMEAWAREEPQSPPRAAQTTPRTGK